VAAEADEGSDLRSTAFLLPSWQLFEQLGLTAALAPQAVPLEALRVIDTQGTPPAPRDIRSFAPAELGAETFGYNLPNWLTRRELARLLAETPGVDLRLGTGFATRLARDAEVRVTTDAGERLTCRLLVGADGRASPVREAAGIDVHTARYGQKALAFAVSHTIAHVNTSTEIYAPGGACTTVPLADRGGRPASAIVWMADGPEALRLSQLPPEALAEALEARSCGTLGAPRLESPVRLWPVVTQRAAGLTARRTVLVAEAAHVLPPIGAQGLNSSLADVAALLEALDGATDPGSEAVLADYDRRRRRDTALRSAVIDLFNRVCKAQNGPLSGLRGAGLEAVHGIAPLRRAVMEAGMGGRAGA
jgi:2-octaprenyl-6-methoxyphenol hydroxylase